MEKPPKRTCKYCTELLKDCSDEGLTCQQCSQSVHLRCLKSGSVPSILHGDIFYIFTCHECSENGNEVFIRDKMPWYRVIALVVYHLQTRNPGLGRKGCFHFRNHVVAHINNHWDMIFPPDFKRKKKWDGTVAGSLSQFKKYIFKSGTSLVGENGWWALVYPKLSPYVISTIYSAFMEEKFRRKALKINVSDEEVFKEVLHLYVEDESLLATQYLEIAVAEPRVEPQTTHRITSTPDVTTSNKRKHILPTFEGPSKKLFNLKRAYGALPALGEDITVACAQVAAPPSVKNGQPHVKKQKVFRDRYAHYKSSLDALERERRTLMAPKLIASTRNETLYTSYSKTEMPPVIWVDDVTFPPWLRTMDLIKYNANVILGGAKNYRVPDRHSIVYVYVQPEHVPVINSLCSQFFWPGIDVSDALQYPEHSCIALYNKLVVGFAFAIPDVAEGENYVSLIFTRPGWRRSGIAKFMMYHLMMVGIDRSFTAHVPLSNEPALRLFEHFGFWVERVDGSFYTQYMPGDNRRDSRNGVFVRTSRYL